MSRHRNLKQYMDDYDIDEDDYYDDDYDDEGAELAKSPPKPKGPVVIQQKKKKGATANEGLQPANVSSVVSAAQKQSLELLRGFVKDNAIKATEQELIQSLEGNEWSVDLAAEALALSMSKLNLGVTSPQSTFTKTLEERPQPAGKSKAPVAAPAVKLPVPTQGKAKAFDFSSPSPDDAIAEARKRQDRNTSGIVLKGKNDNKPDTATASVAKATTMTSIEVKKEPTKKSAVLVDKSVKAAPGAKAATTPVEAAAAEKKEPAKKSKADEKRDEEDDAAEAGQKPLLSLVVIGHVDAGKSTLMGHLLYDLDYVSQKDMHKFEKESRELGKASFKYAWVMDEHTEERERGVTIDVGVKRFETPNRRVVLLDAPGHKDFVPNMITGAAQADAALLVVPAVAGEFESSFSQNGQTKEHAMLVHRLGVQKLIVAVNKMDSCEWSKERFDFIKDSLDQFLKGEVGYDEEDVQYVPCSGLTGDNLVKRTASVPEWTDKRTLVEYLDGLPASKRPTHKPLRMTVADSYKSMQLGTLAIGGKLEAGILRVDDTVLISPINATAKIKSLIVHGQPVRRAKAGDNVEVGLLSKDTSLGEQLGRAGLILCDPKSPVPTPVVVTVRISTLEAMKFPLLNGSQLMFHAHTVAVPCTVLSLSKTLGPNGKDNPRMVKRNETAEIKLKLGHPVCLERFDDFRPLSRMLLRFSGATVAAGVVIEYEKANQV